MSHPYQYVTLRCVPRVERGEFVNVGVVLHCPTLDFLGSAWHLDEDRLRALQPDVDLGALRASLTVVDDVCAGVGGGGRPALTTQGKRFGWLAAPRSTILQPGPIHGGQCENPADALHHLLVRLVHPRSTPTQDDIP